MSDVPHLHPSERQQEADVRLSSWIPEPEVCPHSHLLGSQLPWKVNTTTSLGCPEEALGLGEENRAWHKVH